MQRKLVHGMRPRGEEQKHVCIQQRVGAVVQNGAPEFHGRLVVALMLHGVWC